MPLRVAVIVANVLALTVLVVAVKVAVVAPARTVTFAGTLTEVWLLARLTSAPPDGAGVLRVTVPVELAPPRRLVGSSLSPVSPSGLIVNVAPIEVAPNVPVIVAEACAVTDFVVTVKVAVVAPAGTETLAGTVA